MHWRMRIVIFYHYVDKIIFIPQTIIFCFVFYFFLSSFLLILQYWWICALGYTLRKWFNSRKHMFFYWEKNQFYDFEPFQQWNINCLTNIIKMFSTCIHWTSNNFFEIIDCLFIASLHHFMLSQKFQLYVYKFRNTSDIYTTNTGTRMCTRAHA